MLLEQSFSDYGNLCNLKLIGVASQCEFHGLVQSWTLDCGLDYGLDCGLDYGLLPYRQTSALALHVHVYL